MAELKANNQKPNFDNNPKLIEAIAEMRKNFCAETQNKVINTALACTFLVPAMVEKTTELVADAFANLPQQEQSILILYCVLDMADGEIASLTGMSRSAVQRHRTKTLKELRVKLMALMPEGG